MTINVNRVDYVVKDVMRMDPVTFAKTVGISPQRLSNWKRRGHFPLSAIPLLCKRTGLPAVIFNSDLAPEIPRSSK